MRTKISLLLFMAFAHMLHAQKKRVGVNGNFQGDNAFTVEGFSELSSTNLQQTNFIITNKTADEVEVSYECAITYTCGRVDRKTTNYHFKGYQSIDTGNWLMSTQDKNCIKTEVDGTRNTIVGISYLGLVTKNISAQQREHKKKFNDLVSNVSRYYNAKDYNNALEALTRVAEIASTNEEVTIKQDWDTKITQAMQAEEQKANRKQEQQQKTEKVGANASKNAEDDFWNETSSGNERGGDNKEAYKEYERRKEAEEKKQRDEKAYVDRINKQMEENERERQETARKIDAWSNNMYNTYYAAQAATEARNRLDANTKLSGNYESIQELETEFNQKYNAINQDVQEYKDASSQSIQQGANLLFNDGTASGQATGELVGMLGAMVNNASAEKEARERKEALEKQRKEEEAKINQRKWNAIVELRTKLFQQFADGGTPLSKHNIQQPQVYCFVYSIDSAVLNETQPNLYISNVFPVAQYNDGTWPFKSSLIADIKKKTKTNSVVLMGYYTQKDLAEQMRNGLINLSPKAQLKALAIEYKGTTGQTTTSTTDFWGTETKGAGKATDDFWETDKKDTTKTTTKKKDDFWNN